MASGQHSKKRSLTIPFGKKGSRYVTPTEVSKGLACGCVCPGCDSSLIACQGEKKRPYFRHESGSGCSGGLESVIHGMGKQIILDHGWVLLPAYDAQVQAKDDNGRTIATKRFHAGRRITTFDSVELEKPEATFKPDVTAHIGEEVFFVEIHFTHEVDEVKAEKVRDFGAPMIEICLAEFLEDETVTLAQLERAVLEDAPRHWINNPALADQLKQANLWAQNLEQEVRTLFAELSPLSLVARNEEQQKRSTTDPNLVPLLKPLLGSWILNISEEEWQLAVYKKYIWGSSIGTDIYVRDVEQWLSKEFGFWQPVRGWYSKGVGSEPRPVSHVLTHAKVHWPRLNDLVSEFLEHLLSLRLLIWKAQPGSYRGNYQVRYRGLGQLDAADAEKAHMEKIAESQRKKRALLDHQVAGRSSRMSRQDKPMQKKGNHRLRLCAGCGSIMQSHKCRFCGCYKAVEK